MNLNSKAVFLLEKIMFWKIYVYEHPLMMSNFRGLFLVVFGLGEDLLYKSVLGQCVVLRIIILIIINSITSYE